MIVPSLTRALALLAVLLFVLADAEAQRGRSSSGRSSGISSGRSSGSVSSGRTTSSRPTISTSRSSSSRSPSRGSRPSISIGSTSRGSSHVRSLDSRSSSGSRRGSYVAPTTSRGTTRFLSDRGRTTGTRYDSSPTGRTSDAGRGDAAGSTYVPQFPERGAGWYESRGGRGSIDTSTTSFDAPEAERGPALAPTTELGSPRRYGFPRPYRPSARPSGAAAPTPSRSRPTAVRGSIDTSTASTPSDVAEISQRYRGGGHTATSLRDIADRHSGARTPFVEPGGRRADGGNRYADGPRGRLSPRGEQPTGRLGPQGEQPSGRLVPDAGPASGRRPSSEPTGPSAGESSPGDRGSATLPTGTRRPRPDGVLADTPGSTKVLPPASVTPPSGGGGTGTDGYVTPSSGTTIPSPTITTTYTYYPKHYYYPWSYYCPPVSYWSWHGWLAPHFFSHWYWGWYWPRHYVYTGVGYVYHDDPIVIDNRTYIVESSEPVVGEGVVSYGEPVASVDPDSGTAMELSTAADSYLRLGDRAFREQRYGDAVHFYAKAIEFSPDEGALYLVLADALFATGDYHYAAFAIRRALELDPTLVSAQVDKHDFYGYPEDFDEQLQVLELFVRDHPTDTDARLVLALNYLFGGRAPEAVSLLEGDFSRALRNETAAALILEAARTAR